MTYDCVCDYDPPEFWSRSTPRSRKDRQCYECAGAIKRGETYEYVAGKWDGYFDTFATCERCCDIRTWVKNNVPCFCWAHGNLDEDARSAVDEARWRAPDETVGLTFGLARRFHERNQHNAKARAA